MTSALMSAEPGTATIEMTREFDAPRELVFRAHVEAELLRQWLGPRRFTMNVEELDPRHGGRWHYTHSEPGGTAYGFRGVFHGDPSIECITQTFEFEGFPGHVSLDTIYFDDLDGRTRLRSVSSFQSVADRDAILAAGMEGGVQEGYERLDELLAKLVARTE